MSEPPEVIVLAGCNGAGKTTASRSILADTLGVLTFVNADVIAQGLSGFDPAGAALEASRIMLRRLHELAGQRASFAFETTLAARSLASWLDGLRQSGYVVRLFYFWPGSADLAVARVAMRVRAGGHDVPEGTIRQRYGRSLRNFFELYRPVVSAWHVFDTSAGGPPVPVASGDQSGVEGVQDEERWRRMQQELTE
jgi:predicted ABC-type ATPase